MQGDDDEANELLESQIQENNENIERERQALRDRQISILKDQGQPNWSATNTPSQVAARDNIRGTQAVKAAISSFTGGRFDK